MVSVLVIAKDCESLIEACLESAKWAGEIVVVDTGSVDETIKKARNFSDKVKVYEYGGKEKNFSAWRNFGVEKIKGDYFFALDSDERILEPLKEEILRLSTEQNDFGAWKVARRNVILGESVKYGPFWPDYVIRLFKRDKIRGWSGDVHEQPEFSGQLGTLVHPLLHLTHRDIDSMVLKSLDWANIDVKLRMDAHHPKMSGWRFLRIVFSEMWVQGVIRQGFFNGTIGVIDSLLQVFSMYLSYVKLWQMQRKETLAETYRNIDRKLVENGFKYEEN